MVKIKSILFPVDFSENCHKILPYVQTASSSFPVELAGWCLGPIHGFTVRGLISGGCPPTQEALMPTRLC